MKFLEKIILYCNPVASKQNMEKFNKLSHLSLVLLTLVVKLYRECSQKLEMGPIGSSGAWGN
jgi:hypothetical protein